MLAIRLKAAVWARIFNVLVCGGPVRAGNVNGAGGALQPDLC
jgi:hypothetical protein